MNVWLIMSGEPLEYFGERPHRIGIVSKMLTKKGHDVTWWTTDYDHQHKKFLFGKDTELVNSYGVNMVFLHPEREYRNNVSLDRIKNHKQVGKKFKKMSKDKKLPDLIFCAYPTIELSEEAVKFGEKNKVPVIIDVRDMWPNIFVSPFPKLLRPIVSLLLISYQRKAKFIFEKAFGITGITDFFVEFGLNFGKRVKSSLDRDFPLAYLVDDKEHGLKVSDLEFYKELKVDKFLISFFGTIGKQFDFIPVLEAAKQLNNENVQFVICGKGDFLGKLREMAKDLPNVLVPGWLNKNEMKLIMELSDAALAPYVASEDFLNSLSNKNIEYMSGGLPVFSSIEGVSGSLFKEYECGIVYHNSSEKLEKEIRKLISNKELRDKMAVNALNLFRDRFSADKVYGEMIEYFQLVVKKYNEKNEELT